MFEYLYEWLKDISFYLILVTAVTYVLPSNSYRKYIRFFTGLVLILMLLTPVLNLFRIEEFAGVEKYLSEYENNMPEFIGDINSGDNEVFQSEKVQLEVEEIAIGP